MLAATTIANPEKKSASRISSWLAHCQEFTRGQRLKKGYPRNNSASRVLHRWEALRQSKDAHNTFSPYPNNPMRVDSYPKGNGPLRNTRRTCLRKGCKSRKNKKIHKNKNRPRLESNLGTVTHRPRSKVGALSAPL